MADGYIDDRSAQRCVRWQRRTEQPAALSAAALSAAALSAAALSAAALSAAALSAAAPTDSTGLATASLSMEAAAAANERQHSASISAKDVARRRN